MAQSHTGFTGIDIAFPRQASRIRGATHQINNGRAPTNKALHRKAVSKCPCNN